MKLLKKIWNIFHSMKCAIVLLVILAAVCTVGSLIPQGEVAAYYTTVYPEWAGKFILAVGMDRIFSMWWFLLMAVLLCINLALCSVLRFPQLKKQYRSAYTLESRWEASRETESWMWRPKEEESCKKVFKELHFGNIREEKYDQADWFYSVRNRIGIWGSWICHLGMIAVIIGFGLGQRYMMDTSIYGVPGQEKEVEGTDYKVAINDFQVELREDYTVNQYSADLTVTNTATGSSASGITMVNEPFHAFGMDFFQNSTGWAATVKAYKNDELLQEKVLCQGEVIELEELPLAVQLTAFYPDYINDGSGPSTKTPLLNNPVVVYSIYYNGEFFNMDAIGTGLPITIDEYKFIFVNPQKYTLIQIVRDPMMMYTGLGALVMVIGILLAFFCRTEEIWMRKNMDGNICVYCRSQKGAELFAETVREALEREGEIKEERYVTDADES